MTFIRPLVVLEKPPPREPLPACELCDRHGVWVTPHGRRCRVHVIEGKAIYSAADRLSARARARRAERGDP